MDVKPDASNVSLGGNPPEDPAVYALRLTYQILTQYAWIVIVFPGLFGNFMSFMITIQKDNRRISTCNYMTALALADSTVLIELAWGWRGFDLSDWREDSHNEFAMQMMWYQAFSFGILSGFFLAEMTIDRLIVVRFPMAAPRLCTTRRACVTMLVTFVTICGLHLYIFFTYEYQVNEAGKGFIRMVVHHAPELESLGNALQMAIGTILPFVIIVFCNIWIIIVLRKASEKTGKMGVSKEGQKSREKETTHLTRMLILVSIAYVTTSLPLRLYDILFQLPAVSGFYRWREEYWQLRFYCIHLIISDFWDVNYGINFYLYCLGGGKKYREDVRRRLGQMFPCCWSEK